MRNVIDFRVNHDLSAKTSIVAQSKTNNMCMGNTGRTQTSSENQCRRRFSYMFNNLSFWILIFIFHFFLTQDSYQQQLPPFPNHFCVFSDLILYVQTTMKKSLKTISLYSKTYFPILSQHRIYNLFFRYIFLKLKYSKYLCSFFT